MSPFHRVRCSGLLVAAGVCLSLPALAEGPKERARLDHPGTTWSVRFVKDETTLASVGGNNGLIRFWDPKTGVERATWKGYAERAFSVAFSPDGKVMAAGVDGGRVKLWDVATRRERAAGVGAVGKDHRQVVRALSFSPDGRTLASGAWDRSLRLWDVSTGKQLVSLTAPGEILSLAFSPDGGTLAVGTTERTIQLWDVAERKVRLTLRTKAYRIVAVAFRADGKALLSGNANDMGHFAELGSGEVQLWDLASGKPTLTIDQPQQVAAAVLSPGGKLVATGGEGGTIRLWDAASGKGLAVLAGHKGNTRSLAFSPDGKTLVSGGTDGVVKLWDVDRIVGRP